MADDVNNGASSTPEQDSNNTDQTLKSSEGASDKAQGEEFGPVPYKRFVEINEAKRQAETIANWYRNNIGNPDDVVKFRQWQQSQLEQAKEAEQEGEITPQKLAQIRKLMRNADPEYREMLEERKQEKQERENTAKARMEAQFDDAEEEIRGLAKEQFGLQGKDAEGRISKLAQYVMLEIQNDEKLMRKWMTGNMSCIKQAWKQVLDNHDGLSKSISKLKAEATDKRRISKLPTLPSASGSLTGQNSQSREKGITKQTHDDAWAILQQSMND